MQKVQIILVDDMDGTEADETITFGLDGNQYEIDLTSKRAEHLRKFLAPYTEAARKTQSRRGRPKATEAKAATTTGSRRGGTRKRTTTVEEIEASKQPA